MMSENYLHANPEVQQLLGHLAAIIESSDDAIVSKSLQGRILSWNAGAQRLFGYSAEEAIGRSITLIIPPELLNEERRILETLARGERIDHFETVRLTKHGQRIDVSLTVSPIRDAAGGIVGASKIARDISERKRIEAALREEVRLFESFNRVAGTLAAAQLDLERVVQAVVDAGTDLSGAAFGAFFYYVRHLPEEQQQTLYAVAGVPPEVFAGFGLPTHTPLFSPTMKGGQLLRSADITRDPRYGLDPPHHGLPPGHPAVRSYLAVPVVSGAGEVLGGLFFGHPEPDVFTQRAEHIVAGIAAQAAVALDNARLYESAQREVAQRRRMEEALSDADRRKDEFLALLAHELRNPLAPIRYAVAMGRRHQRSAEQQRQSDEIIERQVGHMSRLLDDLLDVSRITHGTLELRKAPVELTSIVATAIESARPVLDTKQHVLSLDLPKRVIRLEADAVRLSQMFSNLLINAAKYTDPGGQIELSATGTSDEVVVRVRDNGIGISAEMMPRLFTLFAQARPALDRSEGGLGIGLALVRGLAALHGGSVEAHSEGLHRGSVFTVRLPVGKPSTQGRPAASAVTLDVRRGSTLRLVVADDNEDAAEACGMLLRASGYGVKVAYTGERALELAAEARPHALLLDIGMPGLNGYEVARAIRAAEWGQNMTLIALTGWGQEADRRRSIEAGFDYHLVKPVEPEQLNVLLDYVAAADCGADVQRTAT